MAGRTDTSLAKIMGAIIKQQRQKKYPGHGGQMKCAADFGVSQPEWSRWENGQKTPSAANQRKIADFFGIYIGELWGEEKPTTTTKHEPNVKADRETVFLETDEASPSNEKIIYAERIERGEFDRIVNEVVKNAGDDTPAKCFPLLLKRLSPPLWPSNVSIYPVFRFIEASLWRLFLLTRKEAIADSTARILIKKERFSFLVEKLRVIPWPCNQHYYIEIVPAVFEEFIYRLKGKKCPLDIALSFFYLGFIAHAENALRALELEETQN